METGLNRPKLEQFQKDHSPESDEEDGCDDESLND